MKKILCAILLFFCFAGYGFAQQTILYASTHSYKNGVKVKNDKPFFMYITYTDNYNRLYESDEYGNVTHLYQNMYPYVYKYSKTESDYNIYKIDISQYENTRYAPGSYDAYITNPAKPMTLFAGTYKVSQDLSVINFVPRIAIEVSGISVYKRITKAEKEAILREYEESLPKLLR